MIRTGYTTEIFREANSYAQYDDRSALFGPGPGSSATTSTSNNVNSSSTSTNINNPTGGKKSATVKAEEARGLRVEDVEMAVKARSGWEFSEGAPKDVSVAILQPDSAG